MSVRSEVAGIRSTRRSLLAGSASVGMAALLAGCGGGFGDSSGGGGGNGGDSGGGGGGDWNLPDAPQDFPTEDVTLRLVDSNDTKAPYWEALFPAYQQKFPNVTCQYDGLPWNRIEEVVPLGFRNGTAHDLLQLPGSIPLTQAVGEGWVEPLDDHIPDFDTWQQALPDAVKSEGLQVFDGKLYTVPIGTDQRYGAIIHYHKQLVNDAGFDPQSEPFTWDTYRDCAKKITTAGDGQVYGVILEINQPPRLELLINYLARIAGLRTVAGIDQPSGEFAFDADEIVQSIELIQALQSDGSIFPGSNSLTAPECWPRVPRGDAAMVAAGPWVTVQYEAEDPDFDFGVAAVPSPDASGGLANSYNTLGADALCMAATSKVKEVAGHLLGYVTGLDGQTHWGEITGVGNPPIVAEARKASEASYSEQAKACAELAAGLKAGPVPEIANPDAALVLRREKPLTPDFGEVIQAILVGEADDVRTALTDLNDRAEQIRDDAIAEAKKRDGSTATREDWIFPNWDPNADYTAEDYESR